VAQRFANGNAADLEFSGNGVLAKLLAFAQFPAKNFIPESLNDRRTERLSRDRRRFVSL
jgi:hypothetical protein